MKSNVNPVSGKFADETMNQLIADERRLSERTMLDTLKQFGIKLDKTLLLKAGENVIAVDEAFEVLSKDVPEHIKNSLKFDVAFMYVLELWRRWYPDRIVFETLQMRIDNVIGLLENDNISAAARLWYKTWPLCLEFFDKCKVTSAPEFRSRYERYQELLDSILIVADELAERGGRLHFIDARISFYEQLLAKLSPDSELDDLTNRIRALLGDSYMATDRAEMVDDMFNKFLAQNPTWSYAWLDWYHCYLRERTPQGNEKAESILREAMRTLDARTDVFDPELHEHKKQILSALIRFYERFDRPEELQRVIERLEEEYPDEDLQELFEEDDWDDMEKERMGEAASD